MKIILKIAVITISLVLMLIADIPFLTEQLVPEAEAIFGVRRRAWRRGVIVGSTMGAASEAAAMSHQQAAPQQPAPAQQQAAPAAPPPAATGKPLPLGTVVSALPAGCTSTPVGGVEYYYCGGNFYRAVFQGNQLVYVTAKPE
ncbi:MAG: hypothetical protein JRF56_06580 [Deltaproteobacteria bacterium]|jgi:hypothetical protein|nr:hypothetical protein [Deltaproteobacteria bacterium]